ncbi:MarR family transcriptional regulator [Plantibacter sp. LMC-P-059a]|jgi:DNA-binding MarR family transcriptional regulator|uniref:MarR family winged helix-turn-helix transcriptional regulator n=1 Tax=Plantibacter sp. LMC-P-059a TaxID=3040297 RepID=UPI00254E80A2|nr:MarR family transcriptional regulator [Plantibacter sp. LMC-P-059a]
MAIPDARDRRRRSPTHDELRTWRSFIETSERVKRVVADRLQQDSGLSTGDYAVLLALSEAPQRRLRSSFLATEVGWERSRLSHHLGRMERRGLVRREPVPSDSRGAEIVLTEEGARLFRAGSAPHLRAVRAVFAEALSAGQLAALEDAMGSLDAHLRREDIG